MLGEWGCVNMWYVKYYENGGKKAEACLDPPIIDRLYLCVR